MALLTPTSELDAVNTMLTTIGEAPVASLEVSGLSDVAIAKQVLAEVSRAVQTKGWYFNTEKEYPLSPTMEGYLLPPSNTLRVDSNKEYSDVDVVMRGTKLYNLKEHTNIFTKTIKVDLVILLPFDELPEAARYYITIRASRIFQKRVLGSEAIEQFTQSDEGIALATLKEAEVDTGDYNMFNGSYSVASILQR